MLASAVMAKKKAARQKAGRQKGKASKAKGRKAPAFGCVVQHKAPQIVAIDPGHDGWVVGKEPVVLIEFDFEGETTKRLGMPDAHRH